MSLQKPILYTYFRSSCSWRVRIALAYKGIDYKSVPVNLVTGEHLAESYKSINPTSEVPAYSDGGNVISHSVAIMEYLEETVPNPALLPRSPAARAQVRGIVDGIVSGIQPLQNMKVLHHVGEKHQEWGGHWIESGFSALERVLQTTHGKYCFGDELTLADVCLVPQVFNAKRFNVDVTKFPFISEISGRLSELAAFKSTHPFAQADCPEELRA